MNTQDKDYAEFDAFIRQYETMHGSLDDASAWAGWKAARLIAESAKSGWRTIDSANKTSTLLLGYWNENGKWRTTRGCWFTKEQIEDTCEEDEMSEGWYEIPVEGETCYPINPTHWQPLPAAPDA